MKPTCIYQTEIKVCLGILCALTDIHMLVVIDSTLILL